MDGPSHYREAEKWLGFAKQWWESGDDPTSAATANAAATIGQTHATLALTAATALGPAMREFDALTEAWRALIERRRTEAGAA